MDTPRIETLTDVLRRPLRPEHTVGYLTGKDPVFTSYVDLEARARRILGLLQARGIRPGEHVGLVTSSPQVFIESFWGCLLGGAIPLPVSAGASADHQRKLLRVLAMYDDRFLIIDDASWQRAEEFGASEGQEERLSALSPRVLRSDEILAAADGEGPEGVEHNVQPDDFAYVQFSSGSTRAPKGIQLTHRNLVANISAIRSAIQLMPDDRPIGWMPLTHDMGLIGGHLTGMIAGTHHTLIPTERFVRRPLTWLQEAVAQGSTVTSGPNFAYQHVLRAYKPDRFEGLDLSRLRVIFNGAEPIAYDLVRRFLETFAPHGLNPAAMFPVYGLAEASLAVSTPPLLSGLRRTSLDRTHLQLGDRVRPPEAPRDRLDLVPVGTPVDFLDVRIGDGTPLGRAPEGVVGPIWIRGDNVVTSLRTDDDESDPRVDGWYDTGDLGFVLDGDLHICGRVKEMAIVNGQNVFPHDIEEIASEVEGVIPGKLIAIGVRHPETDREVLALFVLWRKSREAFEDVAQRLRQTVVNRTGVQVSIVLPVSAIPKTTSGKLQRLQLARDFEQGKLQ
ncbi:MAG: AMP-binding protein [Myxococcota bacterium]